SGGVPVSTIGSVNIHSPAIYTLSYVAADGAGNSVTNVRVVIVTDTTPPVLTLNGAATINQSENSSFTDPGAAANDACAGSLSVTTSGSVNTTALGSYVLTYIAADPSGNIASNTRTVNITPAPTITTQPASLTTNAGTTAVFTVVATGDSLTYQWLKNGVSLTDGGAATGSTSAALTLSGLLATNAGSYVVIVTNSAGSVTSSVAVLTIIDPTINTQPGNVAAPLNHVAYFSVDAGGTGPFSYQWYSIIGKITTKLKGKTNDTLVIGPITSTMFGSYYVVVSNSLPSSIRSDIARLTLSVSSLTLQTNGNGKIKPFGSPLFGLATNHAVLDVDRDYQIQAIAGAKTIFTNWTDETGTVLSTNSLLTFLMHSNLVLTANFLTNPIVAAGVAGSYNGLFYPVDDSRNPLISESTSGFIGSLVVQTNRTYSGRLYLAGLVHILAGTFDLSGNDTQTIALVGKTNLTVTLHLDWSCGSKQITGTVVSSAGWSAPLRLDLDIYSSTNHFDGAARYTMAVIPADGSPLYSPGGYGFGLVTNNALGQIMLSGALADGTVISQNVPISKNGDWPLFINLYGNKGLIEGWLNFRDGEPEGYVTWIKPGNLGFPPTYKGGFTNSVRVIGSLYVVANPPVLLANDELDITGADKLNLPLTLNVTIENNTLFLLPGVATNAVKGTITPSTGFMTLRFRPTGLGAAQDRTAAGVVLQSYNAGVGAFVGTTNTGAIYLH
ncbi:MAG TPA: immunoglobulin-like domain-containing protein, partial [Candidatus Saccharimonadales bacterium]|nr:immunoglobulin-like domain-containing protein [Candidatus Saccharimonadales bacterium]